MKQTKPDDNPWRALALVSIIGFDIVICMFAGYAIGRYASHITGDQPIWIAVGVIFGFFAGVITTIFIIKSYLEGPNE